MKKERLRIEKLKKGTLLKEVRLQIFEGETVHCVFDNIQEKQMFLKIMTGEEKSITGRSITKSGRFQKVRCPGSCVQR